MTRRDEREIRRDLARAEKDVARTSERRRDLPPGSSRKRVTTANAKWAIACEHRDRLLSELESATRSTGSSYVPPSGRAHGEST